MLKKATFSPAQPWRAKTRLLPSKAAANYHLIRGGWDDPNCARPTWAFSSRALRDDWDSPSHPAPFFSILLIVSRFPAGMGSLVESFTPCQPGLLRHVDRSFFSFADYPVACCGALHSTGIRGAAYCLHRRYSTIAHRRSACPIAN